MKIYEIIREEINLDEAKTVSLKELNRVLRRKGWEKVEGGSHEKWYPPAGISTTDGTAHIAIPRNNCNPNTMKQIIKRAGLTDADF